MSNPPDNNDNSNDNDQEFVQDYLDLLLMSATENPQAQIDTVAADVMSSNNVTPITGSSRRSRNSSVHSLSGNPNTVSERQLYSADIENKPYAEPSQPLTLKAPLPLVKPEVKIEPPPPAEVVETVEEVKVEAPVEVEPPAPEPIPEPVIEVEAEVAVAPLTEWSNGRPAWAQDRFECLLFSVGGLTLAVPLVELGTIYPINDEITPLFGQIDWFMGLLPVKEGNLRTVDTPKVVMPERYHEGMKDNFQYVISINTMDWGLAVDTVSNAIMLEPEDVRWRSKRSKRPWLAGTVIEHMCALIDVSQLAAMFEAEGA